MLSCEVKGSNSGALPLCVVYEEESVLREAHTSPKDCLFILSLSLLLLLGTPEAPVQLGANIISKWHVLLKLPMSLLIDVQPQSCSSWWRAARAGRSCWKASTQNCASASSIKDVFLAEWLMLSQQCPGDTAWMPRGWLQCGVAEQGDGW